MSYKATSLRSEIVPQASLTPSMTSTLEVLYTLPYWFCGKMIKYSNINCFHVLEDLLTLKIKSFYFRSPEISGSLHTVMQRNLLYFLIFFPPFDIMSRNCGEKSLLAFVSVHRRVSWSIYTSWKDKLKLQRTIQTYQLLSRRGTEGQRDGVTEC